MNGITKKLVKSGNSTAVIIPPTMLEMLGWETGTQVEIRAEGERLVVEKDKPRAKLFGGPKA